MNTQKLGNHNFQIEVPHVRFQFLAALSVIWRRVVWYVRRFWRACYRTRLSQKWKQQVQGSTNHKRVSFRHPPCSVRRKLKVTGNVHFAYLLAYWIVNCWVLICVCMWLCMCMCVYVIMYVSMYVCMYVGVYVYMRFPWHTTSFYLDVCLAS